MCKLLQLGHVSPETLAWLVGTGVEGVDMCVCVCMSGRSECVFVDGGGGAGLGMGSLVAGGNGDLKACVSNLPAEFPGKLPW